ncbi:hypothetical protein GAO09_16975 [Rhizobiales bacterium RZME27]|uniref:Uncharacterized protein n=1 Tax=Endobacterium cereale TaxID=2663029 RepID=A0A6A8AG10_9HYPH|nr:hypothetical protein [Endobacterium cereale]MEB2846847.1 hypothetical protein [Endobacterium cereale]MQY47731.1 hypothetical protein [Endobacterium cereale]
MTAGEADLPWGRFASPVRIEHFCKFGDRGTDGAFGFSYNYLDYFFLDENGEEKYMARSYLDEIGTVSVKRSMAELASPAMEAILCYLALRFSRILALGGEGYRELDGPIAASVEKRVEDFLSNSEETA